MQAWRRGPSRLRASLSLVGEGGERGGVPSASRVRGQRLSIAPPLTRPRFAVAPRGHPLPQGEREARSLRWFRFSNSRSQRSAGPVVWRRPGRAGVSPARAGFSLVPPRHARGWSAARRIQQVRACASQCRRRPARRGAARAVDAGAPASQRSTAAILSPWCRASRRGTEGSSPS